MPSKASLTDGGVDAQGRKQPTAAEAYLFYTIIKNMKEKPTIDWDGVANDNNFKNAETAKVRFGQVKRKLGVDMMGPANADGGSPAANTPTTADFGTGSGTAGSAATGTGVKKRTPAKPRATKLRAAPKATSARGKKIAAASESDKFKSSPVVVEDADSSDEMNVITIDDSPSRKKAIKEEDSADEKAVKKEIIKEEQNEDKPLTNFAPKATAHPMFAQDGHSAPVDDLTANASWNMGQEYRDVDMNPRGTIQNYGGQNGQLPMTPARLFGNPHGYGNSHLGFPPAQGNNQITELFTDEELFTGDDSLIRPQPSIFGGPTLWGVNRGNNGDI
ncbi:hypothetical protein B0T25DRAFT_634874 [Lasiosphaeria hispida]|uniref:Myb-like DNA-binding domain-containing protein n=1 Tax=Lasiosphaeria hispida TaxID=260671 RepID=A0AAJ0H8S6_9PEZI|nr:hypothetical protein B0T25DRAFT_634874 [Lasiosphaeria hispida]